MPVIGRLDGKSFHSFTQSLERPWDARFHECLWQAAAAVCASIDDCRLGYAFSDELTIVLVDRGQPWFDYDLQKLCSVAASWMNVHFALAFLDRFPEHAESVHRNPPAFDARFFNVPADALAEVLIWRQQDATRSSLQALARAHFSHDELLGKSDAQVHELLFQDRGINWNHLPTPQKRGAAIVSGPDGWSADRETPIFTQDRAYVESRCR